jgi:hypothetical protein
MSDEKNEYGSYEDVRYCAVPPLPPREFAPDVSDERAAAIIATGNKWVNNTHLHYYLFDNGPFQGSNAEQDVVRQGFEIWKDTDIGLVFSEVSSIADAELRIGFLRGDGSWSVVGTRALSSGQLERTMNFGWNINVPGPNGLDTAVHEIGHALGLHHEHQNPNAGIVWNEETVYDYFALTQDPPWSRETTHFNILRTLDPQTVEGSDWDPNSIMHYSFAAGLIQQPTQYQNGLRPQPGLSQRDIEVVKFFYPADTEALPLPELKPWRSQLLSLGPGEQKDFRIIPSESRNHNFQTFGASDTVMVLFEEVGEDFLYVTGDDDSGLARNAGFRVRLVKGRKYQLRVRLYYAHSSGNTAVMMW